MSLESKIQGKHFTLDRLAKNLSPSQLNYLHKITELEIAKQKLNHIKNFNLLLTDTKKQHKKKSKPKKRKKQKLVSPTSYTKCQCLEKLNTIATGQSSSVDGLIRKKQNLVQDRQRLKYYSNNAIECRQAYFIEQIERKNLQIIYLQQKLQQRKKNNQRSIKELKKQVSKAKRQKQRKKAKTQYQK